MRTTIEPSCKQFKVGDKTKFGREAWVVKTGLSRYAHDEYLYKHTLLFVSRIKAFRIFQKLYVIILKQLSK